MYYKFENLEAIAAEFSHRANAARMKAARHRKNTWAHTTATSEGYVWQLAADILRQTELTN